MGIMGIMGINIGGDALRPCGEPGSIGSGPRSIGGDTLHLNGGGLIIGGDTLRIGGGPRIIGGDRLRMTGLDTGCGLGLRAAGCICSPGLGCGLGNRSGAGKYLSHELSVRFRNARERIRK